jgi:lipoprotein-releasing system permease protein
MRFKDLKILAGGLARSGNSSRFVNFARVAAFISVLLGTFALIMSLSVLNGFESKLMENAVRFSSHVTIFPFFGKPIDDSRNLAEKLRKAVPEISRIEPVLEKEALISHGDDVEGILVKSLNSNRYQFGDESKDYIEFSSPDAREVMIGRRLADKMNLASGDDIIIYIVNSINPGEIPDPLVRKFRIKGIYETGMTKYDELIVYLPYRTAETFFRVMPGSCNKMEIWLTDISRTNSLVPGIGSIAGDNLVARSVFQLHAGIFAWIDLQKEPIPLVLGLISIVAVMNILTTLLIIVVEKTHSIGVLRALGMKRKELIALFVVQGTFIGAAGTLSGSLIAFICWFLQDQFHLIRLNGDIYFLDTLPIGFEAMHYIVIIAVSISLSFISTLAPSYIASKISPLKAIRFR